MNLAQGMPLFLTSAGIVILLQITSRQRKERLQVIHDLETAGPKASAGLAAPKKPHQ